MRAKITKQEDDKRAEAQLWERKLMSLYAHGGGHVGPCRERHDALLLATKLKERLNPKPLSDLIAEAEAVVARFGNSQWVLDAIKEAEEKCAA